MGAPSMAGSCAPLPLTVPLGEAEVRIRTELAIVALRAYVRVIIGRGSVPAGVDG
jgi:hypothetical protein